MKKIILLCAVAASAIAVSAKVVTKPVAYEHAGVKLEGYLAYDDEKFSVEKPAPGRARGAGSGGA